MPADLPFLTGDQIRRATLIGDLVDRVEDAFRAVASGADRSPLRSHVGFEGGDLLLMPGLRAGSGGFSVKLVTVVDDNPSRGLPSVQALVVWFDAGTGRPLALLDGAAVTAMRTGAASGVATRLLARSDAAVLGLIGAGVQAEWQLRAVAAVRPIRQVRVFSRNSDRRDAFCRRMAEATGLEVQPVEEPRAAVAGADVVCCATGSDTPVFDAAWLSPGAHVNGIGAYRLGMVELPVSLFQRASVVTVDSLDAARAEAGDVAAAVEAGAVAWSDVREIGSVERSWASRRPRDAITTFKSVGLAIQDHAAAQLIVERLAPEVGESPPA